MVPTKDFSGLMSSHWALASAAARAAIDSLDRCMVATSAMAVVIPLPEEIEADGSRF